MHGCKHRLSQLTMLAVTCSSGPNHTSQKPHVRPSPPPSPGVVLPPARRLRSILARRLPLSAGTAQHGMAVQGSSAAHQYST
jgi:hypothetical protein